MVGPGRVGVVRIALRVLLAAGILLATPVLARPDHLNAREGDWFVVMVTAGPQGATDVEVSYRTNGRTTGEPMVWGSAIADEDSAGGGVSSIGGLALRAGVAGAAQLKIDIVPPGRGGTLQGSNMMFAPRIEPGQRVTTVFFISGALVRPTPLVTKVGSGSIDAEITSGRGSRAILLLDTKDGAAVEAAVAGGAAGSRYPVDSPGLFGGFTPCTTCLGEWKSPDGRSGDNQTGQDVFAGPPGRWQLKWGGVTRASTSWATVGGYAPIGEYWRYFNFGRGLLA